MIPRVALTLPRDVTQIAPATASSRCSDGDCGGGCYSGLCAICGAVLERQPAEPQLAPAKPVGRLKRGKAARRESKPHFARLLRHDSATTIHPSLLPVCALSTPLAIPTLHRRQFCFTAFNSILSALIGRFLFLFGRCLPFAPRASTLTLASFHLSSRRLVAGPN